jgi:EAL and modified HD-GYP domain-containing signal transduction protein
MAAATEAIDNLENSKEIGPGGPHSVARRPILDLQSRVHAFKLLFRGGSEPDQLGSAAMLETAAILKLEKPTEFKKLTGKLMAFVSCPWQALNEQLAQSLPPTLTVLEIAPIPDPSPEAIAVCDSLKALGFHFALDDCFSQPVAEPLWRLADYVKVDIGRSGLEERKALFERLRGSPVALLAKNVETQKEYLQAREEGFTLFEGYFFCQPMAKKNRRPPANQLLRIQILQALQHHPLELQKLSQLVKRDGPLAFQLLRLVNSPLYAVRQVVESIEGALLAVGDDAFRRIATMAIAREFNGDQPAELLCMAMMRARFCEVCSASRGLDAFGQYLVGLLSLLPAMQGQSMSDLAPSLPLSPEIREALLGTRNKERALLGWLEHFERGDWAGCHVAAETDSLNQNELAKVYREAIAWTETVLFSAE